MSEVVRIDDNAFTFDENVFDQVRKAQPWNNDPKYFNNCRISVTASVKILRHALEGVEYGRIATGTPVEIMGLLIGKFDGHSIVVTDVLPLPVMGIEYQVTAKDEAQVYAMEMMDLLETRRKDRFVGWYHSHPFDVESYSHCHMSSTDCATQFAWQQASRWWTAIVVDPLRSVLKKSPDMGVYRTYPPTVSMGRVNPDGSPVISTSLTIQQWGPSYERYYQLPHSYFASSASAKFLSSLSLATMWGEALTANEDNATHKFAERLANISGYAKLLLQSRVDKNLLRIDKDLRVDKNLRIDKDLRIDKFIPQSRSDKDDADSDADCEKPSTVPDPLFPSVSNTLVSSIDENMSYKHLFTKTFSTLTLPPMLYNNLVRVFSPPVVALYTLYLKHLSHASAPTPSCSTDLQSTMNSLNPSTNSPTTPTNSPTISPINVTINPSTNSPINVATYPPLLCDLLTRHVRLAMRRGWRPTDCTLHYIPSTQASETLLNEVIDSTIQNHTILNHSNNQGFVESKSIHLSRLELLTLEMNMDPISAKPSSTDLSHLNGACESVSQFTISTDPFLPYTSPFCFPFTYYIQPVSSVQSMASSIHPFPTLALLWYQILAGHGESIVEALVKIHHIMSYAYCEAQIKSRKILTNSTRKTIVDFLQTEDSSYLALPQYGEIIDDVSLNVRMHACCANDNLMKQLMLKLRDDHNIDETLFLQHINDILKK